MLFGLGAKIFCTFGWKKLPVWPNFRSMCPEVHFEENNVFTKILFCFSDFERKSSDNGHNFYLRSLNGILTFQSNNFRNFLRNFDDSICHFQTFWEKNGALSKLLYNIPEDRLVKKSPFQVTCFFSNFFGLRAKISGVFGKKNSGWPNFRWMSPQEHIEKNTVLQKEFFLLFQTLSQKRTENLQSFLAGFCKLQDIWLKHFSEFSP